MKTTKLVEVDDFKEVDEVVTVVKTRPEVRDKEIWVKKIIKVGAAWLFRRVCALPLTRLPFPATFRRLSWCRTRRR